ncbi:hypothetical protein AURDEDRAFT_180921 [Auricularia subglabra TFB-10046 SS5]|nr:hypothetical protein AURDEDRAFT_180921 [Auricularia subglabra TFB-10046 SS5]
MSLVDVGSRCSSCGTVDFLPIRCAICTREYCGNDIHGHPCSPPHPEPQPAPPAPVQSQRLERCAFQPCDRLSLDSMSVHAQVLCPACARAFCAYHREPASHQCVPLPHEPEEPRNAEARAILRKHFPDLPQQSSPAPSRTQKPITDPAKLRRLEALEVMKLRHRAKPADPRDTNVPQQNRIHVRVNLRNRPPGDNKLLWFKKARSAPTLISHPLTPSPQSVSTGRAVDLCATLFNINRTGELALYEIRPTTPSALVRLPNERALEDSVSDGTNLILAAPADITPPAAE